MMTVSQLDPKHVDRRIGGLEKDEGAGQRYSRVDRRIGGLEMRKGKA